MAIGIEAEMPRDARVYVGCIHAHAVVLPPTSEHAARTQMERAMRDQVGDIQRACGPLAPTHYAGTDGIARAIGSPVDVIVG